MAKRTHLPPGHKPGPQSQRVTRSAPWAPALLCLFAAGALGGAIALYVTRNHGSRSGHEAGAAVFAGGALLMFALGVWVFRRGVSQGPRAKGVELGVERTEFRRGEQVTVTLRCNSQQIEGRELQVGLVCTRYTDVKEQRYNQYGSYTVRETEPSDVITDWRDVPAGAASQSFTFTVPADGPFSYEGDTVSYAYRVSAREPRRMRTDPHRDIAIWVSP
jgi:hypothetical protein